MDKGVKRRLDTATSRREGMLSEMLSLLGKDSYRSIALGWIVLSTQVLPQTPISDTNLLVCVGHISNT